MSDKLIVFLEQKGEEVLGYIKASEAIKYYNPKHINEAATSYVYRQAKRLRPAVLLMACGCLGGEAREPMAIPAAAGVELFHTWTLVHDDIIDNDNTRRGGPTVHHLMAEAAIADRDNPIISNGNAMAQVYGRDIAILAGDVQHGWAVTLIADCTLRMGVNPAVTLAIIKHMESYVLGNLICGETVDVQMSMGIGIGVGGCKGEPDDCLKMSQDEVINMLWLKTGVLYGFAGTAGAMIGKGTADIEDEQVKAICEFAGNCGIAFQLQDDILGITGDEKVLGKPVGSDIREGKKTTIVLESLKNANEVQRQEILRVLGNKNASDAEIDHVKRLYYDFGGISHTKALAEGYTKKAVPFLEIIPESKYKDLLLYWADYMINRDL